MQLKNIINFAGITAVVLTLTACSAYSTKKAADIDVAFNFHYVLVERPILGLPTKEQIDSLSPYLSKRLQTQLIAARAAEDARQKSHAGSEPPMVQGSAFHSLFEGARRIIDIQAETSVPSSILVLFEYSPDPDSAVDAIKWHDRTFIIHEDGRPVVDDIEYLGKWDFKPSGRLSQLLQGVIDNQVELKKHQ